MKIAIVTDSTADIPEDIAERYHIHVIPNLLIIDGQSYADGKGISRQDFYQRLPYMKVLPTTATASSGSYQELYQQLLHQGADQILSIHASSLLSGICNAARIAARQFDEKIHIFDSGSLSMGLGFQVIAAAEALSNNVPLEQVKQMLSEIHSRVRVIAMLDTLEYVRRSGRVSWARARIGTLLQIKPFVELIEGRGLSKGEVRTRKKGIQKLYEMLQAQGALERLAILHSNAEEDANRFLKRIPQAFHHPPLVVNVTTIIGTHVGPNGLGFAAIKQ